MVPQAFHTRMLSLVAIFLLVNGVLPRFDESSMYETISAVAQGRLDVDGLSETFRAALRG